MPAPTAEKAWPGRALPRAGWGWDPRALPHVTHGGMAVGEEAQGREEPGSPPRPSQEEQSPENSGACWGVQPASPRGALRTRDRCRVAGGNRALPGDNEKRISWRMPGGLRCGEAYSGRLPLGPHVPSPSVPPPSVPASEEFTRVPGEANTATSRASAARWRSGLRSPRSLPWPGSRWTHKVFFC